MPNYDWNIGFIGFGNMGSAIAKGLLKSKAVKKSQIHACGGDYEKLKKNYGRMGINLYETPSDVAKQSDMVFIAVKPYMVEEVIGPIKNKLRGKIVVSVAYGWDFSKYEDLFKGTSVRHISTIPNTPVSVCKGIFVCEDKDNLKKEEKAAFEGLVSAIAEIVYVDLDHMYVAGALAGCGPAYAAMFIEALGDAGVRHGLKRKDAYRIAAKMLAGTAELQLETGAHPGEMKDAVCSPGGTTIKGVVALEKRGFRSAVIAAIKATQD